MRQGMDGRSKERDSSRSQMREKGNIKENSSDETTSQEPGEVATDRLDGGPGGVPLILWVRTAHSSSPCFQDEFSKPYNPI